MWFSPPSHKINKKKLILGASCLSHFLYISASMESYSATQLVHNELFTLVWVLKWGTLDALTVKMNIMIKHVWRMKSKSSLSSFTSSHYCLLSLSVSKNWWNNSRLCIDNLPWVWRWTHSLCLCVNYRRRK